VRVGQGFDAHRLVPGRTLMLGGVEVPFDRGLEGHSDGDVLLHAVASALLGAMGAGDLGEHFPSSDPQWAGVASGILLGRVADMLASSGFTVGNIDATIVAQVPRLGPHAGKMKATIADLLRLAPERVNVKVTSTDGLGDIGREEGIAALAVATVEEEGGRG
jgi:2-C-methyl-D-erythritol 2,4-cyclodiphosphate synthase